jgi:hypothetical protein
MNMDKVRKIMSKDTFNEEDINFLLSHKDLLTIEDLQRLGLAPVKVKEPVVVAQIPSTPSVEAPKVPQVPEAPKRRGRRVQS